MNDGWFNTVPPLGWTPCTSKKGRPYAEFFGLVKGTQRLEGEQSTVEYRISWVHDAENEWGERKTDLLSKLWVQAVDAYRQAHGLDEEQKIMVLDVLDYLRDNSHVVRIKRGLVAGIEPRKGGGRQ